MSEQTVHVAFINGGLNHVGIHEGAVSDVARAVMAKADSFDSTQVSTQVGGNYTGADGQPVELRYRATVTLEDGFSAEWLHVFRRPDEPWPTLAPSDTERGSK